MIKLIAADMDGTLLTDKKEVSPDIFDTIRELKSRGIVFAAASGRQLASLENIFRPVIDDVYFIADSGTILTYRDADLYTDFMDKELAREMIAEIKKIPGVGLLVSGRRHAFTDKPALVEKLSESKFNYKMEYAEELLDISEDIIKLALVDTLDIRENGFKRLQARFSHRATIAISGANCLDITNKNVNKGSALHMLKKRLGVTKEETAAFGDNFNDVEMFSEAYYSFAMEKAAPEVKASARFIAGDNNDHAVVKKIRELCLGE